MSVKISEQALQEKIAQLPHEIAPERDLWTGIERAIESKRLETSQQHSQYRIPMAWAASVIAAVLLTWVSFDPFKMTQAPMNLVSSMQQNFTQQKQTMLVSFGQPDLSQLAPEMQEQLTQLNSAQTTIEKALADDPNNVDLLNLLRWTQQQELDLLKLLYSPQWQSI